MRIHPLNCATMCPTGERLLAGSGRWFGRGRLVCHCWLIETAFDGLVLVDTGLGTADLADPKGRLGAAFCAFAAPACDPREPAVRQVERLGFSARDVRHVVVTHLDPDHAGGLSDFPEAVVHVEAAELDAALSPSTFRERERYRGAHFAHGPRWRPHRSAGETWNGFEAVRTLSRDAEVLLVPLRGHTRGHAGVAVRTSSGWQLHAGDAYFHHGELEATPRCPPGLRAFQRLVAIDDGLRRQNQARLRALAGDAGAGVRITSAHDPTEFDRARAAVATRDRRPLSASVS